MKLKHMDKLMAHFDHYFEQTDCQVIHPVVDVKPHIDVLLYKPTEKLPFWKLVTMGTSDYKMPRVSGGRSSCFRFNEYIMFVDGDLDLNDPEVIGWYYNKLMTVALYPYFSKSYISYGHSFEWEKDDPEDEMSAAFIEFPQVIDDVRVVLCKLSPMKTVACLQVVLLNEAELERLKEIGPEKFSEYLYPDDGGEKHFLSERHRSEKF